MFFDIIQEERAWRRRELTNFKSLIHHARNSHQQSLLRAGILLLYAHWEGYIKKVSETFFYYLNFKGHKYCELKSNFLAVGIADKFNGNFPQNKFSAYASSVQFIVNDAKNLKFKIDVASRVDTKSNLSSEVLIELLEMLGVETQHFNNNKFHIDGRLLKYRNAIAHGERTDNNPTLSIDVSQFNDLYQRINDLIDYFETIVGDHIEYEYYKVV